MDWDKLKTFNYAADSGSLTAAAERLGISQSAVSRQIAALEEAIGVPLFQRHARGLILTGPGKTLADLTRDMANVAAVAESTLKDARDSVIGELVVTTTTAFGATWLAPRLGAFADAFPDVRLQLLLDDREYDLMKLEAECALRLWPATQPDLIQRKLLDVNVSLYASPSYIEARGAPESVDELDQHRIVSYISQENTPLREMSWAVHAGRGDAGPRPAVLTINNVYGMRRAIESGIGIGGLPDYMGHNNPNLVRVLPDEIGPRFEVFFVYPNDLKRSRRIIAFRNFLLQQAAGGV